MLRNPDKILICAIFISGARDLTQNAILAALEVETGDKFKTEPVDLKPIRENALAALAKGDYHQVNGGLALNANFNEKERAVNFWHMVENDLVVIQAVTIEAAVRAAMALERNNWLMTEIAESED